MKGCCDAQQKKEGIKFEKHEQSLLHLIVSTQANVKARSDTDFACNTTECGENESNKAG